MSLLSLVLRSMFLFLTIGIAVARADEATLAVRDTRVIVDGPRTFHLPFTIVRQGGELDGVRIGVETAAGGRNPAVPGQEYLPLPAGTEVLLKPGEKSTTVDVDVIGGAVVESGTTVLLRMTEAHAFNPQPRLTAAALRTPVRGNFPSSTAFADLNGDARTDVVTGNDLSMDISVLLARADGSFDGGVNYPIDIAPQVYRVIVSLADVNGDGHADIVAGGFHADWLLMFAGDGAGHFEKAAWIELNGSDVPSALALRDIDRDGAIDIVAAIGLKGQVLLLAGKGDGTFSGPVNFPTAAGPGSLAVADVNGDGAPDIVTANENSSDHDVSVLIGDGAGSFSPPRHFSVGQAIPRAIAVADVSGSRKLDIITANVSSRGSGSVSILEGDGAGQFGAAVTLPLGAGDGPAGAVDIGDVTGDKLPDIVVTLPAASAAGLLAAAEGGGFTPVRKLPTGVGPNSVRIIDITGDGPVDVVTTNGTGSLSILPGRRDEEISAGARFSAGRFPHSVVTTDLDRDGDADVATANAQSGDVTVFLNDGAGAFTPSLAYPVGPSPLSITSGDVNGDGVADLITGGSSGIALLMGDGTGRFAGAVRFSAGPSQTPYAVAVGDVNGDSHLDVATANANLTTEGISVLLGNGSGGFAPATLFSVGPGPQFRDPKSILLADLTADGHLDILTANLGSSDLSLLAGDGTGNFAEAVTLTAGDGPVAAAFADVTDDGHRDIVALNHTAQTVSVLEGNGRGDFAVPSHYAIYDDSQGPCGDFCPWAWGFTLADITGDGSLDVVTANTDSDSVSVLPNDGAGRFPRVTAFDTGARPGSVVAIDVTGNGNVDVITANRRNDDIAVLPNELMSVQFRDQEAQGTIIRIE